jgi:UDP-N-acetylglucosamine kinase
MLKEVKQAFQINFQPSNLPKLIILGGQPASGKSSIVDSIEKEYANNIVVFNGDDIKSYYPNYHQLSQQQPDLTSKIVQPYSNYVVDQLKLEAISSGVNTLIEGTMRTSQVPLETVAKFKQKGYIAEAVIVVSNYFSSYIGIIERYEGELALQGFGRKVDLSSHNETFNNIPNTLGVLVSSNEFINIKIVTREGEIIAQTATGDDVLQIYQQQRELMTFTNLVELFCRVNKVNSMLESRGAVSCELEQVVKIKQELTQLWTKISVDSVVDYFENIDPQLIGIVKITRQLNCLSTQDLGINIDLISANEVAKQLSQLTKHELPDGIF